MTEFSVSFVLCLRDDSHLLCSAIKLLVTLTMHRAPEIMRGRS